MFLQTFDNVQEVVGRVAKAKRPRAGPAWLPYWLRGGKWLRKRLQEEVVCAEAKRERTRSDETVAHRGILDADCDSPAFGKT